MSKESIHPEFELLRTKRIESLHIDAQEFVHKGTGTTHLHFAAENDENVFLVGLKTIPVDSTGVAHILEHTALCGSEKYPVRDPFFMMIRRSLNTFMNAFTSSDWTAYPFASKNKKDFNNLLEVYLDAVFFSRLDEMDFLQEGHRLEFENADDPGSDLTYKGVVYNEMKGAMSSPVSQLWQTLTRYLYPNTTYRFNSGGDPEHITDLKYGELKDFYRKHYHPSNAILFTFGDIPVREHHDKFHDLALSRFKQEDHGIGVDDEKRYFSPVRMQESYPSEPGESTEHKTHIVMGWLLGHSFDLEQNLEAHLLANVLFENSAAPMQRALEKTKLGHAPSPLCGLEDSNREMAFVCGIEGSDSGKEGDFEKLILDVLEKVAKEGVAKERLDAVLHQLELSQREISGDSYPYGLQVILSALSPSLHGGDALALLDLDPVLESLRAKVSDPEYFKNLVKKLLLDNPHRVTITLKPDEHFDQVKAEMVKAELADIKSNMSDQEKQKIVDQAAALNERQMEKDDESVLPKVGIEDVPLHLSLPTGTLAAGESKLTQYVQGTNGLVYQQIVIDMPKLTQEQQRLLPIYAACVTELGVGKHDYMEMQNLQSAISGGIGTYTSIKGKVDDEQDVKGVVVFSGKALVRNYKALTDLLHDTLDGVRFDEHERIRELVAQMRARREQSVTSNGHALAMGVASSGMSPSAHLGYSSSGVAGIKALKSLDDALESDEQIAKLAETLSSIHKLIKVAPREYLVVAEEEVIEDASNYLAQQEADSKGQSVDILALDPVRENVKEAWITSTQVNFCAKAYPTVPIEHADSPALTVLGGFLRNGYLHRAIREQGGAYGSGASQDSAISAFRFFSYRDPRLSETLDDFDKALAWLQESEHDADELEQAILGVISQIDKPKSPAGEAKSDFHSLLFDRTKEQREKFRASVLNVTLDDLQRVAQTYLQPEKASVGVITHSGNREAVETLGLVVKEL